MPWVCSRQEIYHFKVIECWHMFNSLHHFYALATSPTPNSFCTFTYNCSTLLLALHHDFMNHSTPPRGYYARHLH